MVVVVWYRGTSECRGQEKGRKDGPMVWYHDGVWSAPPTQKISAPHEVTVSSMCDRWCYGMVVWQLLYESDNQSKPLGLGMVPTIPYAHPASVPTSLWFPSRSLKPVLVQKLVHNGSQGPPLFTQYEKGQGFGFEGRIIIM